MMDFTKSTNGIDNTENQQFRRGQNSKLLGNSWLLLPSMLLSFRKEGPGHSGVPYLSPVASYLSEETQDLAKGAKTYLFPEPSQYSLSPEQRQAQNLDRNPRVAVNISIPVAIGVAVLGIIILSIHLGVQAQVNVGR